MVVIPTEGLSCLFMYVQSRQYWKIVEYTLENLVVSLFPGMKRSLALPGLNYIESLAIDNLNWTIGTYIYYVLIDHCVIESHPETLRIVISANDFYRVC